MLRISVTVVFQISSSTIFKNLFLNHKSVITNDRIATIKLAFVILRVQRYLIMKRVHSFLGINVVQQSLLCFIHKRWVA